MPIPKSCAKGSIRTVVSKRGRARVLVCCPKNKWRRGRCAVAMRAIEVKPRAKVKRLAGYNSRAVYPKVSTIKQVTLVRR